MTHEMTQEQEEQQIREKALAGYNRQGASAKEKAEALLKYIESKFMDNTEAPDIPTYVSHWLWANRGFYDADVILILISLFPLPQSKPEIQYGSDTWKSHERYDYE